MLHNMVPRSLRSRGFLLSTKQSLASNIRGSITFPFLAFQSLLQFHDFFNWVF
jgi:hypothetical protein